MNDLEIKGLDLVSLSKYKLNVDDSNTLATVSVDGYNSRWHYPGIETTCNTTTCKELLIRKKGTATE